jgi:enterochelin esterase-like enzyme
MACQPAGDRLAVVTFEDGGELIVTGVPGVTDAERAAAGRETVAGRWRSLLPANRSRAARQHAFATLPAGSNLMRVWQPRDPGMLADRLGASRLTAWAEGDVLHVLWRGQADMVQLAGGVQAQMWPVDGAPGLWEASVRIRCLAGSVISLAVSAQAAGAAGPPQSGDTVMWRGPLSPAARPAADPLRGTLTQHSLESPALGAPRRVTVYRPPAAATRPGPLPGCVLADGQSALRFARVLEPAIMAGEVPPVLLAGVHNAADPTRAWPDLRAAEYLPDRDRRRFGAHLRFVTGTVIPWAAREHGARPAGWIAAGFSNGASWAINAGQRRPGLFTGVAALSPGAVPRRVSRAAAQAGIRHYLAAGTLEAGFRMATREWVQRLERAGLPCRYREWAGGHDSYWWEQHLPEALAWLLSPRLPVPRLAPARSRLPLRTGWALAVTGRRPQGVTAGLPGAAVSRPCRL